MSSSVPPYDPRAWAADPLFRGYGPALEALADLDSWPTAAELDARLGPLVERALGRRVVFRAQRQREEIRYEAAIATRGEVPTRDRSPHDFLNALAWAAFPRAKLALHVRFHEAELVRDVPGRTRFQDRLALLDEGAALRVRCGHGEAGTFVFGHAILEHRIGDKAGARAEVFDFEATTARTADVDAAFAALLRAFPDPAPPRPAGVAITALFPEATT
jgi:hypothetical protein